MAHLEKIEYRGGNITILEVELMITFFNILTYFIWALDLYICESLNLSSHTMFSNREYVDKIFYADGKLEIKKEENSEIPIPDQNSHAESSQH